MVRTAAMDKIIIALDVEELDGALKLVGLLKDHVGAFKIGKQLFTRYGPEAVRMIHERGGKVFLDLKFHDIPTTVAKASREVTRLGVFMFNIHAMGGFDMMRQAVNAVHEMAFSLNCERPKVLAVTVLTSLGPEDLQRIGISADVEELVIRFARLGKDAGVDGVVASPREIGAIKKEYGSDFLVVTPGIRPMSSEGHDQKRTMTPGEAIQTGADYIVVGRPVTQAPDPLAVVKSIIDELVTKKS
jgi:orotidine-5'-phosphate decarboxylase